MKKNEALALEGFGGKALPKKHAVWKGITRHACMTSNRRLSHSSLFLADYATAELPSSQSNAAVCHRHTVIVIRAAPFSA